MSRKISQRLLMMPLPFMFSQNSPEGRRLTTMPDCSLVIRMQFSLLSPQGSSVHPAPSSTVLLSCSAKSSESRRMECVGLRWKVCSDMASSLCDSCRSSPISSELVSMITAFSRATATRRAASSVAAVANCLREEATGSAEGGRGGCVDSLKLWGLVTLLLPTQLPISIINTCIDYNSLLMDIHPRLHSAQGGSSRQKLILLCLRMWWGVPLSFALMHCYPWVANCSTEGVGSSVD